MTQESETSNLCMEQGRIGEELLAKCLGLRAYSFGCIIFSAICSKPYASTRSDPLRLNSRVGRKSPKSNLWSQLNNRRLLNGEQNSAYWPALNFNKKT